MSPCGAVGAFLRETHQGTTLLVASFLLPGPWRLSPLPSSWQDPAPHSGPWTMRTGDSAYPCHCRGAPGEILMTHSLAPLAVDTAAQPRPLSPLTTCFPK